MTELGIYRQTFEYHIKVLGFICVTLLRVIFMLTRSGNGATVKNLVTYYYNLTVISIHLNQLYDMAYTNLSPSRKRILIFVGYSAGRQRLHSEALPAQRGMLVWSIIYTLRLIVKSLR